MNGDSAPHPLTGGQAVVEALIDHGVDTVFGIPGIQLDNLFDAFYAKRNRIRMVHTRHEQGAAYMAMGYAQASGRSGVFAVVPGPGLLNSLAALATAASANLPVLGLTGQIASSHIGEGLGMVHELKDQPAVVRGIIDHMVRANHPGEVPGLLRDCFRRMHSARKQPAVFEMAPDLLGQTAPAESLTPAAPWPGPAPDPELIAMAAAKLSAARRPVIFTGGGAIGAERQLLSLAERIGAPVVASVSGRGVLPDDHVLAYDMLSAQEIWQEVDLALVIGSRFTQQALAWGREQEVELIRLDVDPVQITKPRRPDIALVCSAEQGLAALLQALEGANVGDGQIEPEFIARCQEIGDATRTKLDGLEPLAGMSRALRAALPQDGILVTDVTQVAYFARFGFPVYTPRSFLVPGFQATLGWSYPAALGAKLACPDRKVVAICGDGGFLFAVQELATAVQHRIPVVVVVFDNRAYGNVKTIQANSYGGRHIAVDLANPRPCRPRPVLRHGRRTGRDGGAVGIHPRPAAGERSSGPDRDADGRGAQHLGPDPPAALTGRCAALGGRLNRPRARGAASARDSADEA